MRIRFVPALLSASIIALPLVAAEPKTPASTTGTPATTPENVSAAPAPKHDPNEVVARVNGKEIKRAELDQATRTLNNQLSRSGRSLPVEAMAQLEWDVLEQIISRDLLVEEARTQKFPDIDAKLQAHLDQIKTQLGGEDGLTKALHDTGLTVDEYKERIRENILTQEDVQKVVDEHVKIAPEDIKAFYDGNPDAFLQPELVRASHILVRVPTNATEQVKSEKRAKIEAARARIQKGAKFSDVAREMSEDPGSAANGGDLGFFRRGSMVPEFELTAFTLKTNELSDVTETKFGYHLVLVTDRKTPRVLPLDEVKERIIQYLQSRKAPEVIKQHLEQLRKAARVEILIKKPAEPVPAAAATPAPPARP